MSDRLLPEEFKIRTSIESQTSDGRLDSFTRNASGRNIDPYPQSLYPKTSSSSDELKKSFKSNSPSVKEKEEILNIYEVPSFRVLVSEVRQKLIHGGLEKLFDKAKTCMKILKKPVDSNERYECKIYLLLGYVLDEVMEVERHSDPFKYLMHLDEVLEPRLPTLHDLLKNNYTSKCLIAKALFENFKQTDTFNERNSNGNGSYIESKNKTDPIVFEEIEKFSVEDRVTVESASDSETPTGISFRKYSNSAASSSTTLVNERM